MYSLPVPHVNFRALLRTPLLLFSTIILFPSEQYDHRNTTSLSSWLASESSYALSGILNNIGSSGLKVAGASPGVVVASPSEHSPDCKVNHGLTSANPLLIELDFYTWTRDAALVFKFLADHFIAGDTALEPLIQEYIAAQTKLQILVTPSGGLCTGGLGEPKYHVNLTSFTEAWGRPQHDGPALRVTALVAYARSLIVSYFFSMASVADHCLHAPMQRMGFCVQHMT